MGFTSELFPAFSENNIPVVFSSDDNYAPYLGVTLQSIVMNADKAHNYDIVILDGGICQHHKNLIAMIIAGKSNFSVRYVDILSYLEPYKDLLYVSNHASAANYFRLFIPDIFSNFSKVLYLGCDLVVLCDVADLYKISLKGKIIGAVQDFMGYYQTDGWPEYLEHTLRIVEPAYYFNSGVLLCDIKQMIKKNFMPICLDKLKEIKKPRLWDQDILNAVYHGKICYLDYKFNSMWHWPRHPRIQLIFPPKIIEKIFKASENPLIIHYTSQTKPWNNPHFHLAEHFWHYARQSPFYEEILFRNLKVKVESLQVDLSPERAALRLTADKIKYWRYKLLSKITFGKKRKKYKRKCNELKGRLKMAKDFLKGK